MNTEYTDTVRRFYETHRQELFTYALAVCGSLVAAEDALHEAFYRILRRPRAANHFRAYAFRAVRNAAIDELRHRRRETPADTIFADAAIDADAESRDATRLAVHLLEILSPDERECIVLKLYNDLTFREIAEVRGVSLNTAASWYRRGIAKLRTEFTAHVEPKPCTQGGHHA